MSAHFRLIVALLSIGIALAGCGGGSSSTAATADSAGGPVTSASTPAPEPSTVTEAPRVSSGNGGFYIAAGGSLSKSVSGVVYLDQAIAGATLQVVPNAGDACLQVTLPDGTVLLTDVSFAQADQGSDGTFSIWVTPVSHLVASYRAATGVSEVQAIAAVKNYLGISPGESVNRPYGSTWLSQFSPAVFLQAAAQGGGMAKFTATLVAEIKTGATRSFRQTDPYGALRTTGSVAASSRAISPRIQSDSLLVSVFANTVGDVFAAPILKVFSWFVGKFLIRSETQKELDTIQSQLTIIQQQLTQLGTSLTALGTLELASSVTANALAPLNTFTQSEKLTASSTAGYIPFSPASTATLTPQGLLGLLSQTNALTYATTIVNACLNANGGGNLICGFTLNFATPFGSGGAVTSSGAPSTTPSYLTTAYYYDFRNDTIVTPSIQNCVDFYSTYMAEASNMLQESYNQALGTANSIPAVQIVAGQNVLVGAAQQAVGAGIGTNGVQGLTKRLIQQRPLALLGGQSAFPGAIWAGPGDVFPGLTPPSLSTIMYANGTVWAAAGVEMTTSGTDSGINVFNTVQNFSVNRYNGWYIPTGKQCQQLAARAFQAGINAGHTGKNAIPYGLMTMGLLSQASYNASPDDVKIYCNMTGFYGQSGLSNSLKIQVYDSADNSIGGNGLSNEVNGTTGSDFRPQGGALAIVLLTRPFPGAPTGANIYVSGTIGVDIQRNDFGDGNLGGSNGLQPTAPAFIQSSQTYAALQNAGDSFVNTWESDVALACSDPPSEIVVTQDPNDSHQLHAYAIWAVACDTHRNAGGGSINSYLIYCEVTDVVEWLTSDRTAADVSNFPSTLQTINNQTISGASIVPEATAPTGGVIGGGQVAIENAVISGSSITGGRIYNATSMTGTVSGTLPGGSPFSGQVANASITDGTIVSGTISGGTTYNVVSTSGTPTGTITTGATLSNATITGGTVIAPATNAHAGHLLVHNASAPVTITASWMYNANNAQTTFTPASTWAFVTNPNGVSPSITFPAGTFSDTPKLSYLVISPNNLRIQLSGNGTASQSFYVTGFFSDGSVQDFTTTASFQALIPTVSGQTVTIGPATAATFGAPGTTYQLQFAPTFSYSGNMIVTATIPGGQKAIALLNVLSPP